MYGYYFAFYIQALLLAFAGEFQPYRLWSRYPLQNHGGGNWARE